VFAGFLAEYCSGRTPNPDVLCNREIKFDLCTNYAQRLGGNHFATGHYAKMQYDSDGPALYKAADGDKDQSYFLHAVPRAAFTNVVFPLGSMHKPEVRERARRAGLAVGNKADSTGICFIGERPFEEFLARYIPDSPGDIETLTGEVVGRHRGLPFYTLGQRDGLKIGGRRDHAPEPWYVVRKDAARNALLVAQKHDTTALECTRLRTGPPNWQISQPQLPLEACVKLRYRQPDQVAQIAADCHGGLELRFETPQRAATSGQFAVFYHQERCLGGAQIVETL
jgi:tRNA-specific 2-thiouridylase